MIERVFIEQGRKRVELESYLRRELERAGFTKVEVVKTPLVTRITVNVTRPGLAIGKSGATIRQLTEEIGKRLGVDNPQLEIKEIAEPNLDAQAVANNMRSLIERGFSWRSVAYRTARDVMAAGAQGVEIIVSGKLTGKGDRKRRQRIFDGYMKKVGEQAKWVDSGMASAYPKVGAIGVKVRIVRPDTVFPDKIQLKEFLAARIEQERELREQAREAEAGEAAAAASEGEGVEAAAPVLEDAEAAEKAAAGKGKEGVAPEKKAGTPKKAVARKARAGAAEKAGASDGSAVASEGKERGPAKAEEKPKAEERDKSVAGARELKKGKPAAKQEGLLDKLKHLAGADKEAGK